MFDYVVVGGRFSNNPKEIKASGYMKKLFTSMEAINCKGTLVNGSTFDDLTRIVEKEIHERMTYNYLKVLFWFPDVPNSEEKLLNQIKKDNPHLILISSKNNMGKKYTFLQLVARALKSKSNLFVEFDKGHEGSKIVCASVNDPLGNCFCESAGIDDIATTLMYRVQQLLKFTRTRSTEADIRFVTPNIDKSFYAVVQNHAETFHKQIHTAAHPARLLGNVSFRCESGFPSMKKDGQIYVSKRNIDKRDIGINGFVPVKLKNNRWVGYGGDHKPSVDSPIQLLLYRYYENINFMLHSHVYINDISTTHCKFHDYYNFISEHVIPCGAIEEFYEIIRAIPDRDVKIVRINLKGHGSLVMSSTIEGIEETRYVPRPAPEIHKKY